MSLCIHHRNANKRKCLNSSIHVIELVFFLQIVMATFTLDDTILCCIITSDKRLFSLNIFRIFYLDPRTFFYFSFVTQWPEVKFQMKRKMWKKINFVGICEYFSWFIDHGAERGRSSRLDNGNLLELFVLLGNRIKSNWIKNNVFGVTNALNSVMKRSRKKQLESASTENDLLRSIDSRSLIIFPPIFVYKISFQFCIYICELIRIYSFSLSVLFFQIRNELNQPNNVIC